MKWWAIQRHDGCSKYGLSFINLKTSSGSVTQVLLGNSMAEKISMSTITTSQTRTISLSNKKLPPNPIAIYPLRKKTQVLCRIGSFRFYCIPPHKSPRGSINRSKFMAILKYKQLLAGSS